MTGDENESTGPDPEQTDEAAEDAEPSTPEGTGDEPSAAASEEATAAPAPPPVEESHTEATEAAASPESATESDAESATESDAEAYTASAPAEAASDAEPAATVEPEETEEPSEAAEPADDGDVSAVLLSEVDLPPPASVPVPRAPTPATVLPAATVVDVTPAEGSVLGGTKITIVGHHLHRASIVRIGGVLAAIVGAEEPRELKVIVPEHKSPGPADISIQNPGAELTVAAGAFRYLALPTPKIATVAPNHAAVKGGTEIAITGEGFVKGCIVRIDGQPVARVVFVDGNNLEVKAPAGKNGKMADVVVENPDGKIARAPRAFVYDERYG